MRVLMFFLFHLASVQSGDQSMGHGVVVGHQPSCNQIHPISDDNDVATSHRSLNKFSSAVLSQYPSYLQQRCAQIYLGVGGASTRGMMQHLSGGSRAWVHE